MRYYDAVMGICAPWASLAELKAGPALNSVIADGVLTDALQNASDILYALTGSKWAGVCTDVIRPTAETFLATIPTGSTSGTYFNYTGPAWYGMPGCQFGCVCSWDGLAGWGKTRYQRLRYRPPKTPIVSVTEVRLDGAVLNPNRYRVDDGHYLVYLPQATDKRSVWPCRQDMEAAVSADNTWQITYTAGRTPPIGGKQSAMSLAFQLAVAATPALEGQCRLPRRISTITRQGLTLAVLDPFKIFLDGMTGLADVDLWIAAVNREKRTRGASAFRPGASRLVGHRTP